MKALDLFCGAGGATLGLLQAGFDHVVGIDIEPRHAKVYPGQFIHADIEHLPVRLDDFDFVWASPPCQKFSFGTRNENRHKHRNFIPLTRTLLQDHPHTCIENVPYAPIRADLVLTGPMVGLDRILRKRHFELSWFNLQPPVIHSLGREAWASGHAMTITTSLACPTHFYNRKKNGLPGTVKPKEACEAMGIDIPMTRMQVGEAVPPAYSRYIAQQAIKQMEA